MYILNSFCIYNFVQDSIHNEDVYFLMYVLVDQILDIILIAMKPV